MLITFLFKKIIKICWEQISLIFYQLFKTMLIFEIGREIKKMDIYE